MSRNIFFRHFISWILLVTSLVSSPLFTGQAVSQSSDFDIQLVILDTAPDYFTFQLRSIGKPPANSGNHSWLNEIGDYRLQQIGHPELPFFTRFIEIPVDAEVSYQILEYQTQQVDLPENLSWRGQPIPIDEDFVPGRYQVLSAGNILGTETIPDAPIVISDDIWVGGTRKLKVDIYPFLINQATNKLTWHEKLVGRINIQIQTEGNLTSSRNQELDTGSRPVTQAQSVSSKSQKLKIITDHKGIYTITAADLGDLGLVGLNPDHFKMTSQGLNIAFHIINRNDNDVFDGQEALVFWGEKFDGEYLASVYANENQNWFTFSRQISDGSYDIWKPEFNKIMLEKYTNENVYWLSWDEEPGTQMQTVLGEPHQVTPENNYKTSIRAEENRVWRTFPFTSEETWYWERIQGDTEIIKIYPVAIEFPYLSDDPAILRGSILAAKTFESGTPDHHIKVYINDQTTTFGDFSWDGKSRLNFEFAFPMSYLINGDNQIKLVVVPTSNIPQVDLFIDWLEIEYDREYRVTGQEIIIETKTQISEEYLVKDFSTPDVLILDTENKREPVVVTGWEVQPGSSEQLYDIRFHGPSSQYVIAETSSHETPKELSLYTSPDYLGVKAIDYALITSAELFTATAQLAAYKADSGYQTAVVDFSDLVNDFNFGIYNPIAVKNYFKYLLESQGKLPTYALLVGDGHWNFQHSPNYSDTPIQIPPNLAWVDPWQGEVDSANLLATIVGDDPIADLVIARLPVNTESEALNYLSKLKVFDQTKPVTWHNTHLFIADNPDEAGNFYEYSNNVINTYVNPTPGMLAERIFLEGNPGEINQEIVDFLNNQGSQIVNYIGHGRINGWAAENIFQTTDVGRLNNQYWTPVLVSMTCLDGYWIHPNQSSLIEELIRSEFGAVAAFSPTGLGVSTGHDILHKAFYNALLIDRVQTLGLAVEAAKSALFEAKSDYDLLHTYTIFGDPSIRFNFDRTIYLPGILKGR